ncbi:MAG: flagellar hook protein FlgE [Deltaproteobacteria bacterium]|nr:flagellar hook protein FlgE [Deltaproteobacteria bacterium]
MSISSSMNIGASGLSAHGDAIEITGDNIANANTIGFKGSRATFEDVMGQTVLGSGGQPARTGMGVRLGPVEKNFDQGSLQNTGAVTDLALDGSGFFVYAGTQGGVTGDFYSRAGQLHIAQDGTLQNPQGMRLQGHPVDAQGQLQASVGDLRVANTTLPPLATANATINANLDSGATVPAAFSTADPYGTSSFSTSVTAYDSLGNARKIDVFFRNAGGGTYEWYALTDGSNVTGGTAGTPFQGANGTLTFNTSGALDTVTGNASTWNFLGATAGQALNFDFGDAIAAGGTGLAGSTQFAGASTVQKLEQDGYSAGTIRGISIGDDGVITGSFSNGQKRTIGQVVVATFPSDAGLDRLGSSMFGQTAASGAAMLGDPSTGARGRVVSGSLEQSNVDLGKEFVDLIALQRGFQANSKIVTTADEMLQETMQLKR